MTTQQWETRHYPVSGQHLGWRKSQWEAAGYPPSDIIRGKEGIYILVVTVPATLPQEIDPGALIPQRRRQTWPGFDWRVFVQMLCVLAIVGGIGYLAYQVFAPPRLTIAGVPIETGGMRIDPATGRMVEPSAWERAQGALEDARNWLRGLLPQREPQAQPQAAEPGGWRWPWEARPETQPNAQAGGWTWPPKNPVGDAIDGTMQAITWLTYAVIALGVLWLISFIVGIVRRVRG